MKSFDVFISYAREDHGRARKLAMALEAKGWSVFWDPEILPGETYFNVIKDHLESARAVVVLWSAISIESHWVRDEARLAAARSVLVPAMIDEVLPPLGFGNIQAADLTGWRLGSDHTGFAQLVAGITRLAGKPWRLSGEELLSRAVPPSRISARRRVLVGAAAFTIVTLAVVAASVFRNGNSSGPAGGLADIGPTSVATEAPPATESIPVSPETTLRGAPVETAPATSSVTTPPATTTAPTTTAAPTTSTTTTQPSGPQPVDVRALGVPVVAINSGDTFTQDCGKNACTYENGISYEPDRGWSNRTECPQPLCHSWFGWVPDAPYPAIAGTPHDEVFWSGRWGEFGYALPVLDGEYTVVLRFAEWSAAHPDERRFTASVEGIESPEINIRAEVGFDEVYDLGWDVEVADGVLNIDFIMGAADYPEVRAVLVFRR